MGLIKDKYSVLKIVLTVLIYGFVAMMTLFCIFMQLIYGVKFAFETQVGWIQAYWVAMFIEFVPMSLMRIILSWLLPDYWLWGVMLLIAVSIVWFGTQCEEILTDPLHQLYVCE